MRPKKRSGRYAKRYRPTRAERRLERLVRRARSPFERLCLLRLSFLELERALLRKRPFERVVHCRFCGNWHLFNR